MISLIRKHQPFLMVMITIVVIISFVLFYNINRMTNRGANAAGSQVLATVYGRDLTMEQADRSRRRYQLAGALGLFDYLGSIAGTSDKALDNFILNSIVLDHEAEALHVQADREDIIDEETHLPVFQTNGAFDRDKLAAFIQDELAPKGFTENEIDDLISKDIEMKKMKTLVASTVALPPGEIRFAFEIDNRKMDVSLIRFQLADFEKGIQLSDDDLKKAFAARKDNFKSDEKRKIQFVVFTLSDAEKKLEGRDKNDAMGRLANRASDFTEAMTDKGADFSQVAAKSGLTVHETQPFSASVPDPQIADIPGVIRGAFQMTSADPNSDAVQGEDAFYVLHLEDVVPSSPLSFDEAKPKLEDQLKEERGREKMNLAAADIRNKILADLKAGKSFADSAKALGQQVESLPPFSIADLSEKRDLAEEAGKAADLAPGQVGDFQPSPDGGTILFLEKYEPVDLALFASKEKTLSERFLQGKQEIAFHDWLRIRRAAARVQAAPRGT